jgi:hypothetical protein
MVQAARPAPSVAVTLAYDYPASMGSIPLPDNKPTVSTVLVVVSIAIFLIIVVTFPWWKPKLPALYPL